MSRNKAAGTRWESAIIAFLQSRGWPHAERRALSGSRDRGDVTGIPGWVIEAKAANRLELAAWVDETEAERVNAGAQYGVCWIKRRGKTSPASGYVVLTGDQFASLLESAGY